MKTNEHIDNCSSLRSILAASSETLANCSGRCERSSSHQWAKFLGNIVAKSEKHVMQATSTVQYITQSICNNIIIHNLHALHNSIYIIYNKSESKCEVLLQAMRGSVHLLLWKVSMCRTIWIPCWGFHVCWPQCCNGSSCTFTYDLEGNRATRLTRASGQLRQNNLPVSAGCLFK